MAANNLFTLPMLERVSSRRSQLSRYTDPWTEPLDDEDHEGNVLPVAPPRSSHESTRARRRSSGNVLPMSPRRPSHDSSRPRRSSEAARIADEVIDDEVDEAVEVVEEEEPDLDLDPALYDEAHDDISALPEVLSPLSAPAGTSDDVDPDRRPTEVTIDMSTLPTRVANGDNRSPSPPPGRRNRPRGRKLSMQRTMSTMSSFSLASARKRGVNWIWRIWLAVFPPDDETVKAWIPNYRYTPILSGIVVPFAILLEIPGLTEHWYIRTVGNVTVDYQPNPIILDVGLALSMTCAVVANICLVLRFLEKRVWIMTIFAVTGLVLHDLINISAVTIFGVIHRFNDGFTYGEAFWMTVCSTIASSFVTVTLITDLVKTPDFSRSGSGLTAKQRSLVIVVMTLICYVALGALVNSFANNLSFQDALYFTVVSIETIGFGDIVPTTVFAKIWICAYVTLGILQLALAVGTTRETIVEAFENAYRKRREEIHRRRKEHRESKRKRMELERQMHELGLKPRYVHVRTGRGGAGIMKMVDPKSPAGKRWLAENGHTPIDGSVAASPLSASPTASFQHLPLSSATMSIMNPPPTGTSSITFVPSLATNGNGITATPEGTDAEPMSPGEQAMKMAADLRGEMLLKGKSAETEEESYLEFKKTIEREERREFATKLIVAWSIFFTFWVAGAAIFMKTEGWTFATGMYFCFVAFSTIGYGDDAPQSPAGRSIFTVWALAGVGAMTILISVVSEAYNSRYKNVLSHSMLEKAVKALHEQHVRHEDEEAPQQTTVPAVTPRPSLDRNDSVGRKSALQRAFDRAQRELEALPSELLKQAKALHDHLRFFSKHPHGPLPPELQKLIEDIAEAEKMDARLKASLMDDEEARRTLFMMSYERTLSRLIGSAEKAVTLLSKRDEEHEALVHLDEAAAQDAPTTTAEPPGGARKRMVSEPVLTRLPETQTTRLDAGPTDGGAQGNARIRPRVRIEV